MRRWHSYVIFQKRLDHESDEVHKIEFGNSHKTKWKNSIKRNFKLNARTWLTQHTGCPLLRVKCHRIISMPKQHINLWCYLVAQHIYPTTSFNSHSSTDSLTLTHSNNTVDRQWPKMMLWNTVIECWKFLFVHMPRAQPSVSHSYIPNVSDSEKIPKIKWKSQRRRRGRESGDEETKKMKNHVDAVWPKRLDSKTRKPTSLPDTNDSTHNNN